MSSAWQVRVAAVLVALDAALGVAIALHAIRLLGADPGFLFFILPFLAMGLMIAGLFLTAASLTLALRLMTRARGVRLQAAFLGGGLVLTSVFIAPVVLWVGLLLAVQGGGLVWLMLTPAAKAELDGWLDGFKQPAPWGSTPGTGLWSDAPVQQGPWSPDPTTLPWLGRKGQSGPQPPWWQTWEAGLAQGIPRWEAILLGLAVLGLGSGLLLMLVGMVEDYRIGGLASALIAGSIGLTWFLERRMRARLAGHP